MAELSDQTLGALDRAITERLRAVVPKGASPDVSAANVFLLRELVKQPGDFEGELVGQCELTLSDMQDQIMHDLNEGWPRSVDGTTGERDSGEDLPMPEVAVDSGTLWLWYGDARRPALELPPIRLDEMGLIGQ